MLKFNIVLWILVLLLYILSWTLIAQTAHAEVFTLVYEDGTVGQARIDYYQMTPEESYQLDNVITSWCERNNPRTTDYLIQRATNFILRKAEYNNDGEKCFSPYGVLNGSAVCMGYSLFLQRILDNKGIPNQLVYDRTRTHMYNLVEGQKVDITEIWTARQALSILQQALQLGKTKLSQF